MDNLFFHMLLVYSIASIVLGAILSGMAFVFVWKEWRWPFILTLLLLALLCECWGIGTLVHLSEVR